MRPVLSSAIKLAAIASIFSTAYPAAHACERNCRVAFLGPVFEWYTPRINRAYDVFRSTLVLGLDEQQTASVLDVVEADVAAWKAQALSREKQAEAIRMIFAGGNKDRTKTIWGGECCSCCKNGNCRACPGGSCNDKSNVPSIVEEFRKGHTLCGSEYAAKAYMQMVLNETQRYALGPKVDEYASTVVSKVAEKGVSDEVAQLVTHNAKLAVDNLKNAYNHLSDGLQPSVGDALADHFVCTDHRYDQRNGPPGHQDTWEACRAYPKTNYIPPAPDMSGGNTIPEAINGFVFLSAQNTSTVPTIPDGSAGSANSSESEKSKIDAIDSGTSVTPVMASMALLLFAATLGAIALMVRRKAASQKFPKRREMTEDMTQLLA